MCNYMYMPISFITVLVEYAFSACRLNSLAEELSISLNNLFDIAIADFSDLYQVCYTLYLFLLTVFLCMVCLCSLVMHLLQAKEVLGIRH